MQTKNIVQTSANVIRITSIAAGNVYKRFDDSYSKDIFIGVVKAVHNDGERTFIESTEYKTSYSGVDVSQKIISDKEDVCLFPSSPEELNTVLLEGKKSVERKIRDAEAEITKNQKLLSEITGLVDGSKLAELSASSYSEQTQAQYVERKQAFLGGA